MGRYVVAALVPLFADMALPDSLSAASLSAALQQLWVQLLFFGLLLSKRYLTGLAVLPRFLSD